MTISLSTPIIFIKTLFHHLWLSVSSAKFYERVFYNYNGYGIKYIFNLAFCSSFLCIILFLSNIDQIKSYLNKDIISHNVKEIDNIIGQLPEIHYDGSRISIENQMPFFIYSSNDKKLFVFDLDNKLMPHARSKLIGIFGKDSMIINFIGQDGLYNNLLIKYNKIFGSNEQVLTHNVIKSNLANIFDNASSLFVYFAFPVLAFLIVMNLILGKSILIICVYLITYTFKIKTTFKSSIRVVLFSSGIIALLQFFIMLTFPALTNLLWIIQIWANSLMFAGIFKLQIKYRKFF